jgi:hypothetical protein
VCAGDDGAMGKGYLNTGVVLCRSDIIEVTGHFEEMFSGAGVHYNWWGGGRICGVNVIASNFHVIS